jgi:ABC-type Fe3+ transport system permease subunit
MIGSPVLDRVERSDITNAIALALVLLLFGYLITVGVDRLSATVDKRGHHSSRQRLRWP